MRVLTFSAVVVCVFVASLVAVTTGSARETVGWIEWVKIYPGPIKIKAKVDTGAKSSSLHCICITPIKKEGKDWVSFSVENEEGQIVMLEKPIERIAKIKRHFGEQQERYVVKMGICMGDVYKVTDVTLVDRSGFNYSLLIGRRFMEDDFLVNPGKIFVNSPTCKVAPEK